jgi:UDP-N-acetyl-D-galactosamine dehydrogenase
MILGLTKRIKKIYNIYPTIKIIKNTYDGIIIAVAHKKFKNMGLKFILNLCKKNHIIYDLKYLFSKDQVGFKIIDIINYLTLKKIFFN